MRPGWGTRMIAALLCSIGLTLPSVAEPLPASVAGAWRIRRILPTKNTGCWSIEQARSLVGTSLVYSSGTMKWRDGEVPLLGVVTRQLTAEQFRKENSGSGGGVDFAQLGIRGTRVLEIDLQHEDADITGASTEVPGDSVLVVSPSRILVSACGVYMEAMRAAGSGGSASGRH